MEHGKEVYMQTGFSGNSGRCSSKVQSILGNPPDLGMGLGDRWVTGVYDDLTLGLQFGFHSLKGFPPVSTLHP